MPSASQEDYVDLLKDKYQVSVERVAGCVVSPWEFAYSEAYNRVAIRAIHNKFQKDPFDECYNDARQLFLSRRKSELQ